MSIWDESPLPPPDHPASPPPAGPPASPPGPGDGPHGGPGDGGGSRRRLLGFPAWLVAVVGLVLCVVVVGAIVLATGDEQPDTDAVVAPATTAASMPGTDPGATPPTTPTTPTTTPDTSASATTPATTTPGTSAPTTTATTTTTTNTATTTTTTTPDTTAPTTTAAPTTTIGDQPGVSISGPTSATDADGRRLTVTPRIDACSSGPECLVVAFAIEGFATQPTTFVCEFASGNRYEFRFGSDRVDPACSTGDTPDSIVVEVDGLRSEPITIAD